MKAAVFVFSVICVSTLTSLDSSLYASGGDTGGTRGRIEMATANESRLVDGDSYSSEISSALKESGTVNVYVENPDGSLNKQACAQEEGGIFCPTQN